MDRLEEMRRRFDEKIKTLKASKGKNHQLFTRDEYRAFLSKVKETKEKKCRKTPEEYQRASRYDVVKVGDVEKLVQPLRRDDDPIIYYTCLDENFQIIHGIHTSMGHGGRDRMMKEIKTKYKNITVEMIVTYLNLCEPCQKKMNAPKKGIAVQPGRNGLVSSGCQVNLTDSQPGTEKRFTAKPSLANSLQHMYGYEETRSLIL